MARVYLVEKIVGHKLKGNTHLYKVKWAGFPLDEATYEPAENFVDKTILAKYQKYAGEIHIIFWFNFIY